MLALLLWAVPLIQEPLATWEVPEGLEPMFESVRFARNGANVAYVARRGDAEFVAVTGKHVGAAFDEVLAPVIDSRGEHVAFRAIRRSKLDIEHSVWLDGKRVATDDWIGPVALSPADSTPALWTSSQFPVLVFGNRKASTTSRSVRTDRRSPTWRATGAR